MRKFVTFEEIIDETIKKSECVHKGIICRKNANDFTPGYKIVDDKIYKIKNYKWNLDDWFNYNYWLMHFTHNHKFNKRKLLIMAATNQAKGLKIPNSVLF